MVFGKVSSPDPRLKLPPQRRCTARRIAALAIAAAATTSSVELRADEPAAKGSGIASLDLAQLQYGVAFTGEFVAEPGPLCAPNAPCILGSGAGIAIRIGLRATSGFYGGISYELSKQDSGKLFRLAILQQIRTEGRYYVHTGKNLEPFFAANLGLAGYGNEWGVSSWGPAGGVGVGLEIQASRSTVFGIVLNYRAIRLGEFVDGSGTSRAAGFSHLVGFELSLEGRDRL